MHAISSINRSTKLRNIVVAAFGSVVLVGSISSFAANDVKASILGTPDQKAVESLAIKLLSAPEVKKQKEETLKLLQSDATAKTEDGKKTLRNAVDELAFAATLGAANGDPTHPKLTWAYTAPRTWLGHKVPGSRWGIDNPDNVYRFITVDGASKYEITGKLKQPGPVQFSFLLYDTYFGENTKQKNLDEPIAGLRDRDIKVESDGSFKIIVDNEPGNGRVNHIQSNGDAKILLVRNTFNDWGKQTPIPVEIKRIGGSDEAKLATDKELAQKAADYLKAGTQTLLKFKDAGGLLAAEPNKLNKPFVRGGGWGFGSNGAFKLAKDEALLLTLDPLGAKYLSLDITDPWLVSREHVRANGNLNNIAAQANKDGTFTYVISAKDPGIQNWLDTSGLHEGNIFIRWQALPETTKAADGAVREVKLVKLNDLGKLLPPEATKVTAQERKKQYDLRAASYSHRYTVE